MAGQALLEQGEKRRKAILLYLRSYIDKHGWAPTIQEICEAVDLVSPNATRNHLRKLESLGFLTMQPRVARAISLTDPQPDIKLLSTIKPTRKRAPKKAIETQPAPIEVVAEVTPEPEPVEAKPKAPRRRKPTVSAPVADITPPVEAKPRRRSREKVPA